MDNIVLFGGGPNALCCIDVIEKENKCHIIGITDPYKKIGTDCYKYPVIGRQEQLNELIPKYKIRAGLITIGDNWSRNIVFESVIKQVPDFTFINAIHPSAIIGNDVTLGCNVIALAGCIINPNCRIGNFCLLGMGARLEHDNVIDDFASVLGGAITGGKVKIGKYAAIASGVTVADRITIGKNAVVGAGSVVLKDIPDNVLAYGTPAKQIRTRQIGEKFLKSG